MVEELASKHKRSCLNIDFSQSHLNIAAATIRAWLIKNEIETVYFTGPKSVKDFDIYSEVVRVIEGVQRMDTEDSESHSQ
jgi:hypothetical protein